MEHQPDVQVSANLVVRRDDGRALLLHGPDEKRWWLPGGDMQQYELPAEAVRRIIGNLGPIELDSGAAARHRFAPRPTGLARHTPISWSRRRL